MYTPDMLTAANEAEAARRQLDRVLASAGFARNERLASFLRFVVERHLEGRDDEVKESVLAVEVFGRGSDHDPKQTSIVRTEAARLRARLNEYYLGDGKSDEIVIELPKGGYVPVLHRAISAEAGPPENRRVPRLGRGWLIAGISILAVALIAGGWWRWRLETAPISIAVLPLADLSQDPANDFFADAMTGELIRDLSLLDGLVVRSQTSSFVFKGKPKNIRDAGKQLNVEYILEGSVMRADHKLRINAQLVRVRDDLPVWSGQYDRGLTDVFVIQEEISRGIVNGLRLKLGRGRRRYETSTEAYDLYLRARALEIQKPGNGRNLNVGLYEDAIAKDPSFAPAYAGLAAAYAYRTGEDRKKDWAVLSRDEEIARMHIVVAKALELDPLLPESHAALGTVQARDAQWADADKSFRHSIDLAPNLSQTRVDYVLSVLWPLGRLTEAEEQVRLAEKNDPLSPDIESLATDVFFAAGRMDEASAHCKKPCTRALVLQGRAAEAIPILEAAFGGNPAAPGSGALGYAYAVAGRRDDALRIASLQPRPIAQAQIFVALGDKDRAFEALERAKEMGPVRIGRALTGQELAPLRGDPRLKGLRTKVGLPD